MKAIVADASVILKWVLSDSSEEDVTKAILLRTLACNRQVSIVVPSIWLFEVGNILSLKEPALAEKMIKQIISFDLKEKAWSTEWLTKTLSLVSKFKVSFYDASYHALAIIEGGTFITADKRYVERTASAGSVIYLRDWQG